jgi:hypothetical protein
LNIVADVLLRALQKFALGATPNNNVPHVSGIANGKPSKIDSSFTSNCLGFQLDTKKNILAQRQVT